MPAVVLVHPQIPPNTGNIARTCAATQTPLHLIEPLGFELSDRYLKRAGLDYWPYVTLYCHPDWPTFLKTTRTAGRLVAFEPSAQQIYWDFIFAESDWLVFGSEPAGIPADVLASCDAFLKIPMWQPAVRSLNLSASVAIALMEVYRQLFSSHRHSLT
ncbi:tRNA (cytidine(34)-2'-O)-methyltransferase [uncultured Thermosynechococcus sp.]|uniref:tRNA (cytidine(34)-2'-O)-methyltransferase n=1 Tax=uncultured Thermosynechococcus sp. TaxID=436945 RepID=UPI002636ECBB|nr:tRNA (cytidine(34)-2'-O)-methyltransferase [uncultured Thermosynechococcus sp.]